MRRDAGVEAREGLREDRLDVIEPFNEIGRGPQHRGLYYLKKQRRVPTQC